MQANMMVNELDPDVVRWRLHELCLPSNGNSYGSVTSYERDCGQVGYVREGYQEPAYLNIENDAVIAVAYQEELSKLASAEASGVTNPGQASILSQDWLGPPGRQQNFGYEHDRRATEDPNQNEIYSNNHYQGTHECCSVINEQAGEDSTKGVEPFSEEVVVRTIDITDESSVLDGEVGKRLNQMVSVPHVPKTNGEIPSADEEISDHERLLERLKVYDLVENKVQGDGNCQFRALSDQLYRSCDHHKFVRDQVVSQLKSHPEMYEGYVPMAYGDYLKKMSKNGEWGDHVTLQAAADSYGVKIFMITSFKDTCYIEILPHVQKSNRVICLSFWAEVHYNSIYPEGGKHPNTCYLPLYLLVRVTKRSVLQCLSQFCK
ncbi:hypothetical protein SLEP1_g5516 [Rubroshorea leprosula]|uniref:ubiquitinyl hydrolase 1 n=1 Tax=Rubroshorea leprosula TaxID=152421 RepID=A0AAV5I162_9ROSI|nr:hypothetical protein SLEP1_g5516 [Rubroshorea leprosula]